MAIEKIKAWQCIGCGRIEGAQTCIGICQDRAAEFVHASDYDRLAERTRALAALVAQLARITPREGGWESSYRALQERARKIMDSTGNVE